jgi:hypothetical protein
MNLHVGLVFFATLAFSQLSFGRVIYGEDNRVEVSDATPFQQKLAKSAASMVSNLIINRDPHRPGVVQLGQNTLKDWLESMEDNKIQKSVETDEPSETSAKLSFCEGERFINQPNPGTCSGFLIAPDLIVTAGHCVKDADFCTDYSWVFGFEYDIPSKTAGKDIKETDVYTCKRVISNALNMPLGLDYAVVQLDRKVLDREPLEISNENKIPDQTELFIIGSPSGLPFKVAGGAKVRTNTHPHFFSANLDSFQGNSGSGVFNANSGIIEGILVRGEQDYVLNKEKGCVEAKKCANNTCRGEDVTRLTAIPEVGIQGALNRAAESGNIQNLEKLLSLNVWVDFYSKDGQSALIKAVKARKVDSVEFLISKGADVNLQDSNGDTSLHLLASSSNSTELIEILLKNKARGDLKNNAGETALMKAISAKNTKAIKLLSSLVSQVN